MSTKINISDNKIIFNGHADTNEQCDIITSMCNVLADSNEFKVIKYDSGYAEFEKVSKADKLMFAPTIVTITINWDSHIQSVSTTLVGNVKATWSRSGDSFQGAIIEGTGYTFDVTLSDGYVLDTVMLGEDNDVYLTSQTSTSFTILLSGDDIYSTITLTSKAVPEKGFRKFDLSSSGNWDSLSTGEHSVCIVAKADGYADSVKSTTLTFTKPEQYTINNVLTNITADTNNVITIEEGSTATLKFTANTGYKLPDTITVAGATYTWDKSTDTVTLSNPTANVSITITGVADTVMISGKYAFANTLTTPTTAMNEDVVFHATLSGYIGDCNNISLLPNTGVMNFTKSSSGNTIMAYNFTTNTWADYTSRVIDFGTTEQAVSSAFYKWAVTDGNLSSSIVDTGTFTLADTVDMTPFPTTVSMPLDFTSNGVNYTAIEFSNGTDINYISATQTVQVYTGTWSTAYKTIVINRQSGVPAEFKTWLENNLQPAGAHKVTFASNFTYDNGSGYSPSPTISSDTGNTADLSASSTPGTVWENVTTLTIGGDTNDSAEYVYYTMNGVDEIWYCDTNSTLSLTGDIVITSASFFCLTGDTLITMHDGSQKQIKDIVAGEKVLSYNPETMLLESDTVTYSDSNLNKSYCRYIIYTLSDRTEIKTVHRHRFYNVEKQAMVYMDEWNVGEHFIKIDGTTPYLVSSKVVEEEINHYTIFTEHQNYFANGMLSGNRHTKQMNLK